MCPPKTFKKKEKDDYEILKSSCVICKILLRKILLKTVISLFGVVDVKVYYCVLFAILGKAHSVVFNEKVKSMTPLDLKPLILPIVQKIIAAIRAPELLNLIK